MATEKKLDHTAKKAALKKIKDRLDDVPVQKIIDPAIEKAGISKKLIFGGSIAAAAIALAEYFL